MLLGEEVSGICILGAMWLEVWRSCAGRSYIRQISLPVLKSWPVDIRLHLVSFVGCSTQTVTARTSTLRVIIGQIKKLH